MHCRQGSGGSLLLGSSEEAPELSAQRTGGGGGICLWVNVPALVDCLKHMWDAISRRWAAACTELGWDWGWGSEHVSGGTKISIVDTWKCSRPGVRVQEARTRRQWTHRQAELAGGMPEARVKWPELWELYGSMAMRSLKWINGIYRFSAKLNFIFSSSYLCIMLHNLLVLLLPQVRSNARSLTFLFIHSVGWGPENNKILWWQAQKGRWV